MKFKKIPNNYFITILDRLSRFEPAFIRYKRVCDDIINKFAIGIKLKDLSIDDEISLVEEIFNSSVKINNDFRINSIISSLEEKYFNFNQVSYQYLSSRINISAMLNEIKNNSNLPKNLYWLKNLNSSNLIKEREDKELLYPIEKILLCEGETEKVLLPILLNKFNINLDKLGIMLVAPGGKNQVARKYYSMSDYTKIPFFILLDKDAIQIKALIDKKIRDKDSIYVLKSGEFEDLFSKKFLVDAINYIHKNEFHCSLNDFDELNSNVKNIENIYKKYGFGEFKKAHFANEIKNYIENNPDITFDSEIKDVADTLISIIKTEVN